MYTEKNCWMTENCKKFKESGCPETCPKFVKMDYFYKESLLPDTKRVKMRLVLDADNADMNEYTYLSQVEKDIKNFVLSGNNIFIHSKNCGNGKSEWSIRLLQAYFNAVWASHPLTCAGLFLSVPAYFISLKENLYTDSDYIKKLNNNILSADIVVFDDIATKGITQFESEQLFSIVDARVNSKKSCIFTSNMGINEMYTLLGARLASRIVNFSTEVMFTGKDKRKLR